MEHRVEALVKPELLMWARESAGLSIQIAAKKAHVKPERLESWERGEGRPSVKQLRKLANIYKRPLAVFYLPEPPKTFDALHDFRRLVGEMTSTESPELRLEIRRARDRRELALDLYEEIEGNPPPLLPTANLSDNHEESGILIRRILGITYEDQVGWQNEYVAFNRWRSAFERVGVLIFQATDIKVSEMRGFSISETPLPVIVVNIKDSPSGRIFTMVHEFVHIILREGGLCDLDEDRDRRPEEQRIEVFSNRVAGAAIVPEEDLLVEDIVAAKTDQSPWSDQELRLLARRYKASRETILRRLLIVGRTTEEVYREKRRELQREYTLKKPQTAGFALPHRLAISSAGPLFASLVLGGYYRERITASDFSDYLNIRLRHLPKIEKELLLKAV
jgi:Zn-dependent peptidase ImmA (M78 family)